VQRHRLAPHLAVAARHVGEQRAYARLLELGCNLPRHRFHLGRRRPDRVLEVAQADSWCEQGGKENISFCKPTAAAPRMSVQ